MKTFYGIYTALGLVLLIGTILLGTTGMNKEDLALIEKAVSYNHEDIWPGFDFEKYPIAVRDGNKEFVYHNGEVTKRKPILPVIAATAFKVNGESNVLIPSYKDMGELGTLVEGINSGYEQMLIKKIMMVDAKLTEEQYVGFLYHEAMHAYQIDQYEAQLFFDIPVDYDEYEILRLITEIDNIPALKSFYQEEYELLHKTVEDINFLDEYINARQRRVEELSFYFDNTDVEKILWLEEYYEKVEGTARFVETKVVIDLEAVELYNQYIKDISIYENGKEKYYRSGLGLSTILDSIDEDWRNIVFSSEETMFALLLDKNS